MDVGPVGRAEPLGGRAWRGAAAAPTTQPYWATPAATAPVRARYRTAPAATAYASPALAAVPAGAVSLLCVLGLVPLGMFVYRTRLPGGRAPRGAERHRRPNGAESMLATLRTVPDLWAAAAKTLVPVPQRRRSQRADRGSVGDALRGQATA